MGRGRRGGRRAPLQLAAVALTLRGAGYGVGGLRTLILLLALVFIAVFGFLTLYVLFSTGPDVLVVVSLLVLGLVGAGVIGALSTPPRE